MARSHEGRRLGLLLAGAMLWTLVATSLAVGGAAATGAGAGPQPAPAAGSVQGFDVDRTSFRITVYANGSAEWRFRYETALNDSERQDFEAFAEEFNENETELFDNFRKRARWLADNGSATTGREMSAGAFDRHARVEGLDPQTQALGVVEMSFRWDGFARTTEAGRIDAGDVFEGGLYIGPNQELVFDAGPGLAIETAQPDDADRVVSGDTLADSESVTWTGEKSFSDRRPRVVLTPEDAAGGTPTVTPTPAGTNPGLLLPVGVLLLVVLVGAGAAVGYRTGALPPSGAGDGAAAGPGGDGGAAGADATETPVGVSDAELLSDDERVIDLLEENGGRMKQVDIVEETDWSKSKVSMLLSDMADEGRISKLRVGRENIVSLTGQEPDAAGSPFDDEE